MLFSKHQSREDEFVLKKLWLHKTQSFVLFFYFLAFGFISVDKFYWGSKKREEKKKLEPARSPE